MQYRTFTSLRTVPFQLEHARVATSLAELDVHLLSASVTAFGAIASAHNVGLRPLPPAHISSSSSSSGGKTASKTGSGGGRAFPPSTIITSFPSVDTGFARDVLLRLAGDSRNCVLFTDRSGIAALSIAGQLLTMTLKRETQAPVADAAIRGSGNQLQLGARRVSADPRTRAAAAAAAVAPAAVAAAVVHLRTTQRVPLTGAELRAWREGAGAVHEATPHGTRAAVATTTPAAATATAAGGPSTVADTNRSSHNDRGQSSSAVQPPAPQLANASSATSVSNTDVEMFLPTTAHDSGGGSSSNAVTALTLQHQQQQPVDPLLPASDEDCIVDDSDVSMGLSSGFHSRSLEQEEAEGDTTPVEPDFFHTLRGSDAPVRRAHFHTFPVLSCSIVPPPFADDIGLAPLPDPYGGPHALSNLTLTLSNTAIEGKAAAEQQQRASSSRGGYGSAAEGDHGSMNVVDDAAAAAAAAAAASVNVAARLKHSRVHGTAAPPASSSVHPTTATPSSASTTAVTGPDAASSGIPGDTSTTTAATAASAPAAAPTKPVVFTTNVPVSARVGFLDGEGRADAHAIRNIVELVSPLRLVLVHGSTDATLTLARACAPFCGDVASPRVGDVLDLSSRARQFTASLPDDVFLSAPFQRVGGYDVAFIDVEVGPGESMTLVKPTYAPSTTSLMDADDGVLSSGGHEPSFLRPSMMKLPDLRKRLAKAGILSDIVEGGLVTRAGVVLQVSMCAFVLCYDL